MPTVTIIDLQCYTHTYFYVAGSGQEVCLHQRNYKNMSYYAIVAKMSLHCRNFPTHGNLWVYRHVCEPSLTESSTAQAWIYYKQRYTLFHRFFLQRKTYVIHVALFASIMWKLSRVSPCYFPWRAFPNWQIVLVNNQKAPWLPPVDGKLHRATCLFLVHRFICRNKFLELRCPRILIWMCFNTYGRVAYIWLFGYRCLSPRDFMFLEEGECFTSLCSTVLTRIPSMLCWIQGPTLAFDNTGLTLQLAARFRCRQRHSCIYISRWKQHW